MPWRPRPSLWGEPGTNGQHSFLQLLHRERNVVSAELVGFFTQPLHDMGRDHDLLLAEHCSPSRRRSAVAAAPSSCVKSSMR